jgi:hypothetical protein
VSTIFSVPLLVGTPQQLLTTLSGKEYSLGLNYRNSIEGGWTLDISDNSGNPIAQGIPLVTGANLLAQYAHLGFIGGLYVQTSTNPDAVPTFDNLGADAQLYYLTNP